jgi:hypothetical protein
MHHGFESGMAYPRNLYASRRWGLQRGMENCVPYLLRRAETATFRCRWFGS